MSTPAATDWHSHSWRAMGTQVTLTADLTSQTAGMVVKHVEAIFARLEQRLSRFRANSELSRLNARCGQWVTVSTELAAVLALAEQAHKQTNGTFDPRVLRKLDALGYRGATVPASGTSSGARDTAAPWIVFRDCVTVAIDEPIDLGGIGKGFALDASHAYLSSFSDNFLLCAGGDITYSGQGPDGCWRVGVEWPFDPSALAVVWELPAQRCGALCTSADSKRFWMDSSGQRQHHLIDPISGLPGASGLRSVTVYAKESAAQAEIWSKTLFLRGLSWLDRFGCPSQVLAVDESGHVWVTEKTRHAVVWSAVSLHSWESSI